MKKPTRALVPGFDYLLVDNHRNRVVAEFIGMSRHGYGVLANKQHTYTTRGDIREHLRKGTIKALPNQNKNITGGKPMRFNVETRTSQSYEIKKMNAMMFLCAGLMILASLRAAFLMDQVKDLRAELAQVRGSVNTYHTLVRTAQIEAGRAK